MARPPVKLTNEQIEDIKQRASQGLAYYKLAEEYKIAKYRITEIVENINYRQKYMSQPSAEERNEDYGRKLLAKVKLYWSTFAVGDKVAVKYPFGKRHFVISGLISHKNRYYLNVKSEDDILEVKMSDLILEENKIQIRHL